MYMLMMPYYMILYIKGAFNIKGTTIHPKSSGSLTVEQRTVNVLKNIFKIEVGNIVFNASRFVLPKYRFSSCELDLIEQKYLQAYKVL